MSLKSYLIIFLCLLSICAMSQDMQKGFNYLETGKYHEAESFFQNILSNYPENKTARLCYGRAIGLNGKAEQAKSLFKNLLKDHPEDFEVKLNYGESLLWTQSYSEAKTYFENLIEEQPDSFPALLSYANTLSNLKEYENAINYVNRALEVSPGNNNALKSKKYIYLGFAYQKQQAQRYGEAESLLKDNLKLFIDDKDSLLNLANLYLIANRIEDAKTTYNVLAQNPEHEISALNGLALVSHLKGKEKEALILSTRAFEKLTAKTTEDIIKQTTERFVQALIWNNKFKSAEKLINDLIKLNPNENWA
ncbi:MAG: tetratricopeptide repeat protein, partial [Winogradskyella sp.]|nr:tetratricopeptide repeat protein [Winogradskyella sp.]